MEGILDYSNAETLIGLKEILDILPHRYPFLLVDKVVAIDLEASTIVAQKNVTCNEEFFQGHFPGAPIMPGVLLLEALAQTGGILVHQKGFTNKSAVILNISNAKFRNPVKPGDVLMLHAEGLYVSSKGGRIKGRAMVGNKVAVEVELAFALRDKNQI
jgi:3-hydroxyacyl-[acyl-carrier-protein] dehydratase